MIRKTRTRRTHPASSPSLHEWPRRCRFPTVDTFGTVHRYLCRLHFVFVDPCRTNPQLRLCHLLGNKRAWPTPDFGCLKNTRMEICKPIKRTQSYRGYMFRRRFFVAPPRTPRPEVKCTWVSNQQLSSRPTGLRARKTCVRLYSTVALGLSTLNLPLFCDSSTPYVLSPGEIISHDSRAPLVPAAGNANRVVNGVPAIPFPLVPPTIVL